MKTPIDNDKKNQILKKYSYELSDVERITPNMWSEAMAAYSKQISLSLEDLKDLNIVKIAFSEGQNCEIQSIGGTASRMMVLPDKEDAKRIFKNLLSEAVLH